MPWHLVMMFWKPLLMAWVLWALLSRCWGIPGSRLLALQFILAVMAESAALGMSINNFSNLVLYNVYVVLEFMLLAGYAWQQWNDRRYRTGLVVVIAVLVFVVVPDVVSDSMQGVFASRAYLVGVGLLLPVFVTLLVREAIAVDDMLFRWAGSWVYLGVVLQYGCSIPLLGLLNVLNDTDMEMARKLLRINELILLMRYVIIGSGLMRFPFRDQACTKA